MVWVQWRKCRGIGSLATNAFVVTHISTAAAALSWMILEWVYRDNPTVLVPPRVQWQDSLPLPSIRVRGPVSAIIIGLVGGAVCFFAINLKSNSDMTIP